MSTANDTQVGGQHYKAKTIHPWDYIAANGLGYFEGNIVSYVSRWRDKGGLDDLRKARHYLDKLIELEENAAWLERSRWPLLLRRLHVDHGDRR